MHGRITFPGNPWPAGHTLESVDFVVRLNAATSDLPAHASLDLALASDEYSAPMGWEEACRAADAQYEANPDITDWESMIVWNNYHATKIEAVWTHPDLVLATPDAPLEMGRFDAFRRHVDPHGAIDPDAHDYFDARAFTCYILGHDAVAGHRIAITRDPASGLYRIDWSGHVAKAYGGDNVFRHTFEATAHDVPFHGFIGRIPQEEREGLSLAAREARLRVLAAVLVADPGDLVFRPLWDGAADRLVPRAD